MSNIINLHNFTVGAPVNASVAERMAKPASVILPSSVVQTQAHDKVSERYQFVNTGALIEGLQAQGLVLRKAEQSRSNKYAGFQKHIVRMGLSDARYTKVGDTVPEIIIINSHMGGNSLQLRLGLYRLVCSNGLVVGSEFGSARIRHFGNNVQQIVEDALNDLHTQLPLVAETVEAMRERSMTIDEAMSFARQALALRGAPAKLVAKGDDAVTRMVSNLLVPQRKEDVAPRLWEVFNRTQESIIRGTRGLRRITSATRDIDLNKGLWNIAEGFLKAA